MFEVGYYGCVVSEGEIVKIWGCFMGTIHAFPGSFFNVMSLPISS